MYRKPCHTPYFPLAQFLAWSTTYQPTQFPYARDIPYKISIIPRVLVLVLQRSYFLFFKCFCSFSDMPYDYNNINIGY